MLIFVWVDPSVSHCYGSSFESWVAATQMIDPNDDWKLVPVMRLRSETCRVFPTYVCYPSGFTRFISSPFFLNGNGVGVKHHRFFGGLK